MAEGDPAVFLNNLPFLQDGTSGLPSNGGGGGPAGFGFGGAPGRPSINGLAGGLSGGYSSPAFTTGTNANPLSLSSGYAGAGGYSGEGLSLFGYQDACIDLCTVPETIQVETVVVGPECDCFRDNSTEAPVIVDGNLTVPQTTDEGSTAEEDMETVSNEGESEFDEPTSESETDENASDDVVEKLSLIHI